MIDALQQSHAKLSKQVRTLEQERQHHLTIIERLKEYAPQHVLRVLEAEQKIISQLSTDSAISMSGGDTLPSDNTTTSLKNTKSNGVVMS